jgi:DNA-binding transcriptional LysR family regulator
MHLDWEDIRFFAVLARHRTLAATARALDTKPSVIERRLNHLETMLGHALFTRSASGFRINAAGAAALTEAAQMEMAACSLMHKLRATVP